MNSGVKTIIYPVKDLAATKPIFSELLGVEPVMDQPYYVQFQLAGQAIGLDPNGHTQGMTQPTIYWHVDDLNGTLAGLLAAGATEKQAVKDVGGGKLVASVADQDGNVIGLIQDV